MHLSFCHNVQNMQSFVVNNCFKIRIWMISPSLLFLPAWEWPQKVWLWWTRLLTVHISVMFPCSLVFYCVQYVFIKRAEVRLRWRVIDIAHSWGWFPNFSLKRDKMTNNEKENICIGLLLYLISVLYTCLFIHLMLHPLQKHLDKSFFCN